MSSASWLPEPPPFVLPRGTCDLPNCEWAQRARRCPHPPGSCCFAPLNGVPFSPTSSCPRGFEMHVTMQQVLHAAPDSSSFASSSSPTSASPLSSSSTSTITQPQPCATETPSAASNPSESNVAWHACSEPGCNKQYKEYSQLVRHSKYGICKLDGLSYDDQWSKSHQRLSSLFRSELRPTVRAPDTPRAAPKTAKAPQVHVCQVGDCLARFTLRSSLRKHYKRTGTHGWLGQAIMDLTDNTSTRISRRTNRAKQCLSNLTPPLQAMVKESAERYARRAQPKDSPHFA